MPDSLSVQLIKYINEMPSFAKLSGESVTHQLSQLQTPSYQKQFVDFIYYS